MTRRVVRDGLLVLLVLALVAGVAAGQRRRPASGSMPARPVVVPVPLLRPGLIRPGFNARVRVLGPSRLDWSFVTPADVLAATPREALAGYMATQTIYQLFIPPTYRANQAHPLIFFVSPSDNPNELVRFEALCRKYGVIFASPYFAGDDTTPARRIRIALDVLDDVRLRLRVDTDRLYLAGFAGGAPVADQIAFSYPEVVGGVLSLGAAGGLRSEPYLRDRVAQRLSVALACGEMSPLRGEMQQYRHPVLRDSEVRTKLWLTPRAGHALPPAGQLEEMFAWLEDARTDRARLPRKYPTLRVADGAVPGAEDWAEGLVVEARKRLEDRQTRDSGLMLLDGVVGRWKGSEAARVASRELARHDDGKKVYRRRQQEFAYREATALDAYLAAPRVPPDRLRKLLLERLAVACWQEVEKNGPDTKEGLEAGRRLGELRKRVPVR